MNKTVPLVIDKMLLEFEGFAKKHNLNLTRENSKTLFCLSCKHKEHKFYFRIDEIKRKRVFDIDLPWTNRFINSCFPIDEYSMIEEEPKRSSLKGLRKRFDNWIRLVAKYQNTREPFQDEFSKLYEEKFNELFPDEDDDNKFYSKGNQEKIKLLLSQTISFLEENKTESNKNEYNLIIQECVDAEANLQIEVKSVFKRRIASIAAKLWKAGPDVIKGAWGSLLAEGILNLGKFLLGG